MTVWTPKRLSQLREIAGHSDMPSARMLGEIFGCSRQAIIGACSRNKIELQRTAADNSSMVPLVKREKKPKKSKVWKPQSVEKPMQAAVAIADVVPRDLPLSELADHDCRYPSGDGPFLFCGNPVQDGSSYCSQHHRLCWTKPSPPKLHTYRDMKRNAA